MIWNRVRLGDVCSKIGSGATPKGGSAVYVESGTSFIRSQNVYNLFFQYDGLTYITDDAARRLAGVTVFENDVLLNITGDSVARTCVAPKNVLPARVNQHVAIIRPNEEVLNPFFLNYYLASPYMQALMLGLAVGKGASRNAMTKDMISNFEIPCPPIETQNKIATILRKYDELVLDSQKQRMLLEEITERLYQKQFVAPAKNGTIPSEWKEETLSNVVSVLRRGISPTYDDSGKYTVISQKCIRQSIMDISEARKEIKTFPKELELQDEDTVICSTGTGTLGRVGQVFGQYENTTYDSHVTLVRADTAKIGKEYLYRTIKSQQQYLMSMGRGSTNQQELYKSIIEELRILVPTQEEIETFEKTARDVHNKISVLLQQERLLLEARDRLLPKLMNGEIEI